MKGDRNCGPILGSKKVLSHNLPSGILVYALEPVDTPYDEKRTYEAFVPLRIVIPSSDSPIARVHESENQRSLESPGTRSVASNFV